MVIERGNFDKFKKAAEAPRPEPAVHESGIQLLNLEKGQVLDLTKYSNCLEHVRASAGWKINHRGGGDYDLDLCAYLVDKSGHVKLVYYGDMHSAGIDLDEDNQKGTESGDAENLDIRLKQIKNKVTDIYIAVVIFRAEEFRQCFGHVKNAYIRLVDVDNGNHEICRYNMTEDGGSNTAVLAARLKRNPDGKSWSFEAIGTYSKDSVRTLQEKLR